MVLRSRVMATFSSRSALARGPEWAAGAGAGVATRASSAASMSPLVTRPSRPVPATAEVGKPLSLGNAARRGHGRHIGFDFGFCRGGRFHDRRRLGRFGLGAGAAALAPAAPSLIEPSRLPTCTVPPAWTEIDSIAPSAGAGTSTVTLSVSSSSRGSSRLTASPSS